MTRRFWFEDRATEKYYSFGKKKNGMTDWGTKIFHTKEEYDAYWAGNKEGKSIYRGGEKTNLQRVDELICEFMGDPAPDINRDSEFFYLMHTWGYLALLNKGGSTVGDKEEHLPYIKEFVLDLFKDKPEGYQARVEMLIEWVFLRKWRFHGTG